jgi:hypothetical protein
MRGRGENQSNSLTAARGAKSFRFNDMSLCAGEWINAFSQFPNGLHIGVKASASDPKVCALLGESDAQANESGATFRSQAIPLARPLR